jgi:acyl-CoA synthetase (AMP-forming)/AMP-acid ligase II
MDRVKNLPYSSVAGALQYQSENQPNKKAILYPDSQTNCTSYSYLTYKQFDNVTNHLAEKISNYLSFNCLNESITCALLAVGGIEYFLCQYALLKLENVIMFPISARNSQSAIEHLLRETKTNLLLTTSQYFTLIKTIQQQQDEFKDLQILFLDSEQFQFEQLLINKDKEYSYQSKFIQKRQKTDEELNKVVVTLHRLYISLFI